MSASLPEVSSSMRKLSQAVTGILGSIETLVGTREAARSS